MNDIFHFAIILIISNTQFDVVYNKVSVEEYRRHETGTSIRKSYANSQAGFLEMSKAIDDFKQGNKADECFINMAGDQGGFMGGIIKFLQVSYTEADVKAYHTSAKTDTVTDAVYAGFCHEMMIKNTTRK